jgi:hypothetical protein
LPATNTTAASAKVLLCLTALLAAEQALQPVSAVPESLPVKLQSANLPALPHPRVVLLQATLQL